MKRPKRRKLLSIIDDPSVVTLPKFPNPIDNICVYSNVEPSIMAHQSKHLLDIIPGSVLESVSSRKGVIYHTKNNDGQYSC